MSMKNYVAVLPDGSEHYEDSYDARQVAQDVVRKAGITTSRKNPQQVSVKVYELTIKAGKVHRGYGSDIKVMPYRIPMTETEFNEEMREITDQVPEAFRPYVTSESWDRGHSDGYEEVVLIAGNIVHALLPGIKRYTNDLAKIVLEESVRARR